MWYGKEIFWCVCVCNALERIATPAENLVTTFRILDDSRVAITVSNEEVVVRKHSYCRRFAEFRLTISGLKGCTKYELWNRMIFPIEFHHLMESDVCHPNVIVVIDGQAMRHVK